MISEKVLDAALRELFELSPVPLSISTVEHNSRYIKVNAAYLRMIGRSWQEIAGQSIGVDLPYSIDDPDRLRRMRLLNTQGFYELEEIDMQHVSGRIIPTLISAQRRRIDGESFDIEIILDNSERKAFEQALQHAAQTDVMTGLSNRSHFESHLRATLAAPAAERLFLTYLDLNRFKRVNDRLGHSAGDRLLQVIASRLVDWAGPRDFVARLGGDEFAIVSRHPADEQFSLGRYLDLAANIAMPIDIDGTSVIVGAAIGIAEVSGDISFDALLDRADRLMYAAKASGDLIDVRSEVVDCDSRATGADGAAGRATTQLRRAG